MPSGTITTQNRVNDSVSFVVGFEQYGTCSVPKYNTGGPVFIIYNGRHHVGAYNDHLFMHAGLYVLSAGGQGINKAGTCGGEVVSRSEERRVGKECVDRCISWGWP